MLVNSHSGDQAQSAKHVHDAVDRRLGDGQDETSTGPKKRATCDRRTTLGVVIEVLEHGEHRDRIESLGNAQVIRKSSFDVADALCRVWLAEVGVDSDSASDPAAQQAEQGAVGTTNVEDMGTLWNVRRRLRDAPTLERAIECLQVARA